MANARASQKFPQFITYLAIDRKKVIKALKGRRSSRLVFKAVLERNQNDCVLRPQEASGTEDGK